MAANQSISASNAINEEALQKSRFFAPFTADESLQGDESLPAGAQDRDDSSTPKKTLFQQEYDTVAAEILQKTQEWCEKAKTGKSIDELPEVQRLFNHQVLRPCEANLRKVLQKIRRFSKTLDLMLMNNQDVRNFVKRSELQESKQLLNANDVRTLSYWNQFSVFQNEVYVFDPFPYPSNVVKLTVYQPGSGKPTEVEPIECIEAFWVKALCITRKNYVACLILIPRETSDEESGKKSNRNSYERRGGTGETSYYNLMLKEFNLVIRKQVSSNYLCQMSEEAAESAKFTLLGLTQVESPRIKLLLIDHDKNIISIFKRQSGSTSTEKLWQVQQIYILLSRSVENEQNFERNQETLKKLMQRQSEINNGSADARQDEHDLLEASNTSDLPVMLSYDFSFACKIAVATYSSFATIYSIHYAAQSSDEESANDVPDFNFLKRSVIHPQANCSFACCAISRRQFFIVSSRNKVTESAFFDLFDVYGKRLQSVFQKLQVPKVLSSHSKTNSCFALLEHEQDNELQLIYKPADGGELRVDILRFPNKVSRLKLGIGSEATHLSGLADPAQSVDENEDREIVLEIKNLFAKGDTNTPSICSVWNCKDHFTFLDWGNNKIKRIQKTSRDSSRNPVEVLYSRALGPKIDEKHNLTGFCVWDNQRLIVVEDNWWLKVVDTNQKAELYSLQFTKRRPKLLAYLSFALPVGGNMLTVTFTSSKSLFDIACSRDQKEWRVWREYKLPKEFCVVDVTFDKPSSRLALAWRNLRTKHSQIVLFHRIAESLIFLSVIELPETSYVTGLTLHRSICCASISRVDEGVVTYFYNVKTCKEIIKSDNRVQTASALTYISTENADRINFCRYANSIDGEKCIIRFKRSYVNSYSQN